MGQLMGVLEIAEYLKVNKQTIYNWVNKKGIPFTKVGDLLRFDRDEIDTWLKNKSFQPDASGETAKGVKKEQKGPAAAKKRRYTRLTTQVHVKYKVAGMIEGETETIDISGTGMRFPLDKKLESGVIELEIDIPDQGKPIFTLGEVIWCRLGASDAKAQFEIGIQFVGMKDPDKHRIIEYIHAKHAQGKE